MKDYTQCLVRDNCQVDMQYYETKYLSDTFLPEEVCQGLID